jgi:hypothetical protein
MKGSYVPDINDSIDEVRITWDVAVEKTLDEKYTRVDILAEDRAQNPDGKHDAQF